MYPLYSLVFSLCLSTSWARPVRMSEESNADNTIDFTSLSTSLGEYYEGITDQVMISFSQSLASSQDPSEDFARSLTRIDYLHSNLLAAIQPLVDTNLPWIITPPSKSDKKTKQDDDDEEEEEEDDNEDENDDDEKERTENEVKESHLAIWSIPLKKDIRVLNERMSSQLGQIIQTHLLTQHQTVSFYQHSLYRSSETQDWLAQQLLTITNTLKQEFNKRIQEVVQCILEDFVL